MAVENKCSSEGNGESIAAIMLLLFWIFVLNETESTRKVITELPAKTMSEPRFDSLSFMFFGVYFLLSHNGNQLVLRLK